MDTTPQRLLITSRKELDSQLAALMARARRAIRCCSEDGSIFALDAPQMVTLMQRLVLDYRGARVQILIDDPRWIETRAPRFKAMQRPLAHAVQLRCANRQDAVAGDMQVIVDDAHCLELKPGVLAAGEAWVNNPRRVQPMLADFERRWVAASHDLPVVPLGL